MNMGPNPTFCCRNGGTRRPPNGSSGTCFVLAPCRARLAPISFVATRQPRPTSPDLANVKHVFVKAAARVNNRAENSHQPTRERERRMRGFRDPERTQAFLPNFGLIRQHFALKRHLRNRPTTPVLDSMLISDS